MLFFLFLNSICVRTQDKGAFSLSPKVPLNISFTTNAHPNLLPIVFSFFKS